MKGTVWYRRDVMGNTYTSLHYHFVFSTKERESWLGHDIEERVWQFLGGIARENGMVPILVGGMPDHIFMASLCDLGRGCERAAFERRRQTKRARIAPRPLIGIVIGDV